MGFPTLVTPMHCSETLREWVGKLTEVDREKLRLWGIPSKLLRAANVEVSRHLLCTAARFWKPAHHVFHFGRTELMPTLEKVCRICGFSHKLGEAADPAYFFQHGCQLCSCEAEDKVRRLPESHRSA